MRSIGGRCWLGLALALLLSPLSSWAEPSAREALAQAEAALTRAETALTEAGKALAASREDSMALRATLTELTQEVERLRAEYGMRLKDLEAQKMLSAELGTSLTAAQAEARAAEGWAVGLGLGALAFLLGWIFL